MLLDELEKVAQLNKSVAKGFAEGEKKEGGDHGGPLAVPEAPTTPGAPGGPHARGPAHVAATEQVKQLFSHFADGKPHEAIAKGAHPGAHGPAGHDAKGHDKDGKGHDAHDGKGHDLHDAHEAAHALEAKPGTPGAAHALEDVSKVGKDGKLAAHGLEDVSKTHGLEDVSKTHGLEDVSKGGPAAHLPVALPNHDLNVGPDLAKVPATGMGTGPVPMPVPDLAAAPHADDSHGARGGRAGSR